MTNSNEKIEEILGQLRMDFVALKTTVNHANLSKIKDSIHSIEKSIDPDLDSRLDEIEKKVELLNQMKWKAIGVVSALVLFIEPIFNSCINLNKI